MGMGVIHSQQATLTEKSFSAARPTEILNQILKNPGSSQPRGRAPHSYKDGRPMQWDGSLGSWVKAPPAEEPPEPERAGRGGVS